MRAFIARNHLMRGGLIIGFGILTGNVLGFVRGAVTAYLLGTHALADSLAVAIGPVDTLNAVLINTMVFAFVPLLASRQGAQRLALYARAARLFRWVFCSFSGVMICFAPWVVRALGPGLEPSVYPEAVNLVRILSLSTLAAGAAALHSTLLLTERRFGPSAFYQALLNLFVIAGALLLWKTAGIYGFAVGYTTGAFAQLILVYSFARRSSRDLRRMASADHPAADEHTNRELLAKPGSFLVYAGMLALNMIITRAYATQAGPGMAAAFDYCVRCVNVVIAYLVSPASNSLLPEIARLRSEHRIPDATRLIHRTLGLTAILAVVSYAVGVLLREPVIAILFQRGSFTSESTKLVAGVFLGFAPSLIGLSLLEIGARSLFALDRPWLPVIAATTPVLINLCVSLLLHPTAPYQIGLGASTGLICGFGMLFLLSRTRAKDLLSA